MTSPERPSKQPHHIQSQGPSALSSRDDTRRRRENPSSSWRGSAAPTAVGNGDAFEGLIEKYSKNSPSTAQAATSPLTNSSSGGATAASASSSGTGSSSSTSCDSEVVNSASRSVAGKEECLDDNELSSKALKAMMKGDMETYNRLNSMVLKRQTEGGGNRLVRDEEKGRTVAAAADRATDERMRGVLKDLSFNEDDREISNDKGEGSRRKHQQKQQRQQHQQRQQKHRRDEKECSYCMGSGSFRSMRKESIVAATSHAFLCHQSFKQTFIPHHCFIAPTLHMSSIVEVEDDVYQEIRNFQKSFVAFCDHQGKSAVFIETVLQQVNEENKWMGGGPHTVMQCIPLELDLVGVARGYFRKAFSECESEWSDHKKIIDCHGKRGPRGHIPKGFAYIHVDIGMDGKSFAHVIEDLREFPKHFGRDVILGMLELETTYKPYRDLNDYQKAVVSFKESFRPFDWTAARR
eukprot:GHVS01056550.1.p1 GENE.GHVS01056550.1~~GHVS01056550.1.p1  ORF type:complete len:492 (-),score=96.46 GHVS01056550.1:423-1814(-)